MVEKARKDRAVYPLVVQGEWIMSHTDDPTKPTPNDEKFKPKNVASDDEHGRATRNMHDVPRGSDGDRRRAAQNRVD